MANVYFELTEAFNAERPTAALAAGQAVVFYRLAIMSKDGDWIVHESTAACESRLIVIDLESLIAMKRTQRAKDYAVIGALATLLPAERELEVTSDPDRLLALARVAGPPKTRPRVADAVTRGDRRATVIALAEEIDDQQQRDRRRVERYQAAAAPYLEAARAHRLGELPLVEAHQRLVEDAERLLPIHAGPDDDHVE